MGIDVKTNEKTVRIGHIEKDNTTDIIKKYFKELSGYGYGIQIYIQ